MTRDEALQQLEALNHIGALRIITNEHNCGAGKHPSIPPFDVAVCAAYQYPQTDPRHFVIHAVTTVAPARGAGGERGHYVAYTAEGDYCQGQPEALLSRLTEANKV